MSQHTFPPGNFALLPVLLLPHLKAPQCLRCAYTPVTGTSLAFGTGPCT